jgi:hypothetical protein
MAAFRLRLQRLGMRILRDLTISQLWISRQGAVRAILDVAMEQAAERGGDAG